MKQKELIDAFYPEPFEWEWPSYCKTCGSCGIPGCCPNACKYQDAYKSEHDWLQEDSNIMWAAHKGNLMAQQLVEMDKIWL